MYPRLVHSCFFLLLLTIISESATLILFSYTVNDAKFGEILSVCLSVCLSVPIPNLILVSKVDRWSRIVHEWDSLILGRIFDW